MTYTLYEGDCLKHLRKLPDNSIDSCVTDPPYGLSEHSPQDVVACLISWLAGQEYKPATTKRGFMGHAWDAWVPGPEVWREVLRVLKPGGHALIFAGTRSMDLMMMAVRLAGFEIRDAIGSASDDGDPLQPGLLAWAYAQGFPKNADVSKLIDKAHGNEREDAVTGGHMGMSVGAGEGHSDEAKAFSSTIPHRVGLGSVTKGTPVHEDAKAWEGWGTSLKPAWEPIIIARKPLIGTIAKNVLEHGVGGINIDGCRVPMADDADADAYREKCASVVGLDSNRNGAAYGEWKGERQDSSSPLGRWPSNLVHDGSEEVVSQFPNDSEGCKPHRVAASAETVAKNKEKGWGMGALDRVVGYDDGGNKSAARFFYCAKASKRDREEGCEDLVRGVVVEGTKAWPANLDAGTERGQKGGRGNIHPTVKPTRLMRWLVRLVTPPGGTTVDPFAGSGSTGKAAILEGFDVVLMEAEAVHVPIIKARCDWAVRESEKTQTRKVDIDQGSLF